MTGTSLALIGELDQAGAITPVGLRLSHVIEYEKYESLCYMVGQAASMLQFVAGDLVLYGEHVYGERSYQALEGLKASPETKQRWRRVAERVPMERRRADLTWSHHQVVSHLAPIAQTYWLKEAATNNWSKVKLEEHARDHREREPKLCPACGYTL